MVRVRFRRTLAAVILALGAAAALAGGSRPAPGRPALGLPVGRSRVRESHRPPPQQQFRARHLVRAGVHRAR